MSGIEAVVLLPLVYGCVHLGKKVLDQSRVIDTQNALIDTQRQTITALQTTPSSSDASGLGGMFSSSSIAQRAVAYSGVAVAASVLAFNAGRWILQSQNRQAEGSPREMHPAATGGTYTPSLATSEQDECKICCEHQRDTLLLPCRHFALCWNCAQKILSSNDPKCPICRIDIATAQVAFVS